MKDSRMDAPETGMVMRAESALFHVQIGDDLIPCTLRGRLKKRWLMVSSLVVVGDIVTLTRAPDGGVIEEVHDRRTTLSRPGFRGYEHVVAANVDQLLIVASAYQPPFKRHLVDRFLLHSRHCGLEPVVIVTKCDLADERVIGSWVAPLEDAGVTVLLTSAVTGQGVDALHGVLKGKVSVLAGQSGVGKSTLLNAVDPAFSAVTGAVNRHARGSHTTTSSRIYPLPFGGCIVDTPGIKELSLWEPDDESLGDAFPEVGELAPFCKFRDCRHDREPRCAVKEAVAAGELDEGRYRSYLKLQRTRR